MNRRDSEFTVFRAVLPVDGDAVCLGEKRPGSRELLQFRPCWCLKLCRVKPACGRRVLEQGTACLQPRSLAGVEPSAFIQERERLRVGFSRNRSVDK